MLKVSNIYTSDEVGDILFTILNQIIQNNDTIRTCQNCGKYFIPNKLNEIYCDFYIKMALLVGTKEQDRHTRKIFRTYLVYWNIEEHIIKKFNAVSRNKEDKKLKRKF